MAEITGGELLLRCLHAEGVRYINAITDGTYMMVIEAIERLGDELGIKLIVPRHEAAAAHACDAYTRVTGDPAVVMASGKGCTGGLPVCLSPGYGDSTPGIVPLHTFSGISGSPLSTYDLHSRSLTHVAQKGRVYGTTEPPNILRRIMNILSTSAPAALGKPFRPD